jgi:tetratricopeptide (TPR) repeat protein
MVAEYAWRIGDLDQAERCYNTATNDAVKLNKIKDEKVTLLELTNNVLMLWGRYNEALSNYHSLLDYFSKSPGDQNLKYKSEALLGIGDIHARRRDGIDIALTNFDASLEISRKISDKVGEAMALLQMGNVYRKQGENDKALEKYNESLRIQNQIGNQIGIARTEHEIGNIYQNLRKDSEAFEHYNRSLSIKRRLEVRYDIAITVLEIGSLLVTRGEYEEALSYLLEAHLLLEYLGNLLDTRALDNLQRIRETIGVEKFDSVRSEIIQDIIKRYDLGFTHKSTVDIP